ncbi:MAG: nickel pincer cofactor biosynthesis protein LarC [Planctomycetota bacterium]|nr:nickel pincer cofactor biosynthesis protein LarC [Planctomycetota bacterium]
MNVAYFDCFAGAGGDMIVASLIDAGADAAAVSGGLAGLPLHGLHVATEAVVREGLGALRFIVDDQAHEHGHEGHHEHPHRGLTDVLDIIARGNLPPAAAANAVKVFERLAKAEAKVHRTTVDKVHFHEVGAVDSIADIVGACLAMELLKIEKVYCSAIPVGWGTIQCAHGILPVPAPATAELLIGAPTVPGPMEGEATTPTAAAIFTSLASGFGPPPAMTVTSVGYGAGTRQTKPLPNLLRVVIGQAGGSETEQTADAVVELSANIDDATGEIIGLAIERLLAAGCLDAWASPIVMKQSRPAWQVSALCAQADVDAAEGILFAETTTFGVRRRPATRTKLSREWATVETSYGPIRVKVGRRAGVEVTASPEFSDVRAAAGAHHVSAKEVYAAAMAAYRARE